MCPTLSLTAGRYLMLPIAKTVFGRATGVSRWPTHQTVVHASLREISERHICVRLIRTSSVVRKQDSMDTFEPFPHFATSALHVGQEPEQWNSRAVIPPISMSTTFKQFEPAKFAVRNIDQSSNIPPPPPPYCLCQLTQ